MKYKAVIFDMDGTILDTLQDLTDSVNYALDRMGYDRRTAMEIRSFLGNGVGQLINESVPEGISEDEYIKTFSYFKEYYSKHNLDKTKPYDGIIETMRALKSKGIKMAIVSNKLESAVIELKEAFFKDVIDIAVGDAKGRRRKPAPDSCEIALELLGCSKEEVVYVGDSEVDFMTALNAGLDCITVLWGFRDRTELEEIGARHFALKPADIESEVLHC